MAEVSITEIPNELTAGDVDPDADFLEVDDTSANQTKRISPRSIVAGGGALLASEPALAAAPPAAPGATDVINANAIQGKAFLSNISSPAGEPADLSGGPYYLEISDGGNTETVVVTERSGATRTLAGPLEHGYSAGSTTVAYAGPATTPAVRGLMPAPALHQLLALAGAVVVFADGRVPVTGDLQLDAGAQLTAKSPAGNVELGPTGNGAIKMRVNGGQVAEVDANGVNLASGKTLLDGDGRRIDTQAPQELGGLTWIVAAGNHGLTYYCTNAAGCTVTVNTGLPAGTIVTFIRKAAGDVTVAAGGGMTLEHPASLAPTTRELHSPITVQYLTSTTVQILGHLADAP